MMINLTSINEALGLASTAVGLTGKAADTAATLRDLFTGEKPKDNGEAVKLLNSLASELVSANISNVQLSEALKSLNVALQRQDEFTQQKARYELFQTELGDTVFKLKESALDGDKVHYICPVCLNRDNLISYLRPGHYMTCQTDKSHFYNFGKPPQEPSRRKGWVV